MRSKKNDEFFVECMIIAAISCLMVCLLLTFLLPGREESIVKKPVRFIVKESIDLPEELTGITKSFILVDAKTDLEYLYIEKNQNSISLTLLPGKNNGIR